MKIGIVCYPTFGGSGVVATELGFSLAEKGYEIHFITYKQPVRLEKMNNNIHFHQVYITEYPLFQYQPYELALSSKITSVVKKHQIDLLHVHYAIPHAYAAYSAKQMLAQSGINVPIVTTLHGTDITLVGSHPYYKPAVEFSINNSDVVTSVSESLREDSYRLFDIHKNIKVIPNFIDLEKNVNKLKDGCKFFVEEGERALIHISNFRKVKRIQDVVQIFSKVQRKIPSKLIMVGEGSEKEMAEDLCEKLKITDSVIFLGNCDGIDQLLKSSDVFLLPSQTESFGLAALEAMSNGVPVVSSDVGGIPEVNKQGVSGYLCSVGDVDAMVERTLEILSDEYTLLKFKKQAREVALTFDVKNILPIYEQAYQEAINNKSI